MVLEWGPMVDALGGSRERLIGPDASALTAFGMQEAHLLASPAAVLVLAREPRPGDGGWTAD